MSILNQSKQPAKIESVQGPFKENHGLLTTMVHLDLGGAHQGFGGLALNEKLAESYVRDLCDTFAVERLEDLVGMHCYALYSWRGSLNYLIEGLECVHNGRRFLHNVWRKKHFPETPSVYWQRFDAIERNIMFYERRIEELQKEQSTLADNYVDWENMP